LTARAARPFVRSRPGVLEVSDERVFGLGSAALARRFARRVVGFDEVRSLALDPARGTATLTYRAGNGASGRFLLRLADAVAEDRAADASETELPDWSGDAPVILYRHAGVVSIFAEVNIVDGCLTARHPALESNPAAARRVEDALRALPGVIEITATAKLQVRFDPDAVAALQLVRIAEHELLERETVHPVTLPEPVNFRLENVMVGVSAVGEFVLPLMAPVASGLLVLAGLGTFGTAASQFRERRIGLPLLYSCAVGARLASGQFLAASLLSWLFRYWEQRYRQEVATENRNLLGETAALPKQARVLTVDGGVHLVRRPQVAPGQQVRVLAGERVPIDGRVLAGAALVDERLLGGQSDPVRRFTGDMVLAGSRLIAGALEVETVRVGNDTRVARVARTLIDITVPQAHPEALNLDAGRFAGQAVAPTLLAAGAGVVVGGMTTAAAILSPDYATGVGLAVPLERVRGVKSAFRLGAVICSGDALERFASVSWIVLDEHEALHRTGCEVAEIGAKRLDATRLLPAMAAAGVWLGDERGPALVRACRARGLVVRRAQPREIDRDGVAIRLGAHLVRLRGCPAMTASAPPPLIVEVDGVEAGGVRFRRNGRPAAAEAIRQLHRDGLRVLLASEQPAGAAALIAGQLGADRHCGEMRQEDKIRLLRELRQQRVAAAYLGDASLEASVAREAQLSIALSSAAELRLGPADIVLPGPSLAPLPALFALARHSVRRIERARQTALAPNLLSVAGAFAFDFTAMAAVLISNLGTSAVYNRAKRSLRGAEDARLDAGWHVEPDCAPERAKGPNPRRSA
jgi:cation transport ATPase